MSRDPIDELERRLRSAVRVEYAPSLRDRVRARLRLPLVAVVAGLSLAGGVAIAATGALLPEGPSLKSSSPLSAPRPDAGAGVVKGATRLLSLRVADPDGGPPWGLRVFTSTRESSCVQVGRVQNGKLGQVTTGADGAQRFRPIAPIPGENSLCSSVTRDGLPVLRGLRRLDVRGGTSDPRRCSGGPCPIDRVLVLRYGLLGPGARSVTFVSAKRRGTTQRTREGGAYLFVEPVDPGPFQRADAAQQKFAQQFEVEVAKRKAAGATEREATMAAFRVARAGQRPSRDVAFQRPTDGVLATFSNGKRLQVAGPGRTTAALPGVTPSRGTATDVRAKLDVTVHGAGARRSFSVAFRAPVAIRRADRRYTLTATGADGGRCTRIIPGGGQATTRNIDRGERVVFRRISARQNTGTNRRTWCPGAHSLRVGYTSPASGFRGALVGRYRFFVSRP